MAETGDNQQLTEASAGERSHSEIMVVMTALMLVVLLAALDQTIVATALPRIAIDLHGLNKLSWVATAYLLTSAVSTPLYGKISDQLGRKKILQFAILIFLAGSALCGLSQSMSELIFFRALQGIGAGGLISLALSVVGDVVSPRQRGKYQGYFGAVFGVASVAGPLLGGFLTDSLSWRWIFYVNIPIGILALAVIASRLHLPVHKRMHSLDFVGAGLLTAGVVALLLATVWGGTTYAWDSTTIVGLLVGGTLLSAAFVLREKYAAEPIIPLRLFRNDIFSVSVMLSFLAGITMFAAILYIPEYQQVVRGYSPTKSGLMLVPLVFGLLVASIVSGRLISKFGRYRIFPIIGTAVLTLGLWLFSHLSLTTTTLTLGIWMVVIGAGLGLFMQVMTLAVQNSVDRSELGVATASTTFFRSMGSSFGGAIFGAILINRLSYHLKALLPANAGQSTTINTNSLQSGVNLHGVPPNIAHDVLQAFVSSFHDMFLYALPFSVLMFIIALFLREAPLRSSAHLPSDDSDDIESHSPVEI